MPGASSAPAASRAKVKSTRASHHRSAAALRHSLRDGFNGFLRALPGDRALLSPSPARCESIGANLMPASRHQDHTTSPSASASPVLRRYSVHRIPHPTFVTIAIRPSYRARDARISKGDLPDVTSKSGCDRLARRANQPFADEPKTPDVNDQSSFRVLPAGRAHATVSRLGNAAAALKSSIVSCLTLAVVAAEAIVQQAFPPGRCLALPGITVDRRREPGTTTGKSTLMVFPPICAKTL